jgi:tetratricopeptide (TPR) repeat protein
MVTNKTSGIRRFKGKEQKLYKQILIEIKKEIQIHPNYADLYNQLGLLLMAQGDRVGAENYFLESLSLNPRYREANINLGFLYFETKRLQEAKKIFLPQARKYSKDGLLQHVLGILYLQEGKRKEALIRIRKAVQCHSYYRDYYRKIGIWRGGIPHLDQKTERFFKRTRLNYHYAQFHNFSGLYLAKKGKATQAVRELQKAASLKPDEFLFHANLGTVYYYQGAYRKAIQEYKRALKMDPSYGMGYANLSYTYGLMSRTREALRSMEKAVRLSPRYADLHYNLALLYSDRKRYKKAISALKKALRINPSYLFARINLGVLYEDQKKWSHARREYRKILEINPDDDDVRRRLQRIS